MVKPLKIMILANDTTYTYNLRGELIDRLIKFGHEIDLVCEIWDHDCDLRQMGCHIHSLSVNRHRKSPTSDIKLLKQYIAYMKRMKPDIVLPFNIKPCIYGGIACRMQRIPYIVNITGLGNSIENGGILSIITKTLYRIAIKKAACVLFQNQSNRDLFTKHGICRGKTRVIPGSGVNLQKYLVLEYPDTSSGINFLFLGRVMKAKGIDELIVAMRNVKQAYPAAKLDVVGGCDEDYEERLREAEKSQTLTYHGQQTDVISFIARSHCTVLPSYHEGTSNVLLESAASGRPVITTNAAGCRETFEEGVTGIGCAVKDVVSLTRSMIDFINLSDIEKKEMGIAGRTRMVNTYDREFVIRAYMEEIELAVKG